ncbi:MAG: DUF488 domain-containing protein [Clostridiales bacterium]|nr:DUF488 domain-containing protein [Clostridiales bacterium]MCM1576986.1 DUF488 domain-containing protein [Bacteroides sp.]
MKIYTSYFGNLKKLYAAGIEPIGIARWQPKWFFGRNMKHLAPTAYMLSDSCSQEDYVKLYGEILKHLDLEQLKRDFETIGHDVALCCYEKPDDFCHRHLLAEYLNKNGWDVKEFGIKVNVKSKEDKDSNAEQMLLF